MERVQAQPQVTQVSRQADPFKTGIERPFGDRFICQGIQDSVRDALSLRQVNDLYLAAVHSITEEEDFKGWRFCVFVHAAFRQIDIAECLNIDTDCFHTLHLEKAARHKAPPPLFTTTCSGRIPSACDDILLPGAGPFLHPAGLF